MDGEFTQGSTHDALVQAINGFWEREREVFSRDELPDW